MPEMTAAEAAGQPICDSLDDIIKVLDAMYNSEKFIKKADYWSRCAGEAALILHRIASGELAPVPNGFPVETGQRVGNWKIIGADFQSRTITLKENQSDMHQTQSGKDDSHE